MTEKKKLPPALAALIVIVLVGIVASVVIAINSNTNNTTSDTHDHSAHSSHDHTHGPTDDAKVDAADVSEYKDGTYTATGSYLSPGGRESIELTVVIKDGVITETSLVAQATDREAEEHQELFAGHYKELVVGKKINGLSLSRVAGSSLTSNGFNDALQEIRNDART